MKLNATHIQQFKCAESCQAIELDCVKAPIFPTQAYDINMTLQFQAYVASNKALL